ncbi:MAG: hypothetical protein ACK4YP_18740, partial [Myxococcota bacterium]
MPDPAYATGPSPVPPPPDDGRRELAVAFGVGLLGAIVLLGRVFAAPTRRFVGDWQAPDVLAYHWVADRVARFDGLLHTDAVFAPIGDTLLARLGGGAPVFSAPLLAALGWPLGANVYVALVCAANVVAGALLARTVGAGRPASLLGGLAFGLSPYLLGEVAGGRLGQVPAWALAAGIACWIRVLRAPSRRDALLAATFVGIATFEYAWYGLLGGLAAACLAVAAVLADRTRLRDKAWTREVTIAGALALLASIPGAALVASGLPAAAEARVPQPLAIEYSLPPLWPISSAGGPVVPAAISGVLAALAAVAVWRSLGDRGAWVVRALVGVAGLGWVLSMGPRMLTAGGPVVDSHFPFYWLYSTLLPGFLYPYQHALLVTLALAPLAALGLTALAGRAQLVLAVVLALVIPAELLARGVDLRPPVSQLAPEPPWIAELRALPAGAILGLPLAPEMRVSQEALLLQMLHEHPIVDGPTMWRDDRRPAAWDAAVADSGFLTELVRFERGREVAGDPARANYFRYPVEDVAALTRRGVRWVMVWDTLYPESLRGLARAERKLLEQLCGKPAFAAKGIAVYDLGAHAADGNVLAPLWRMPEEVRTGDGVRRMAGRVPPGVLVERLR